MVPAISHIGSFSHYFYRKLPVHLLDAVFFAERGTMSVGFKESHRAVAILEKIRVRNPFFY